MQAKKYISIKAKPLVSIITFNWNQTAITCEFLESSRCLQYDHYEIIVCDLGSAVNPIEILINNYPKTRLVKADAGDNWINNENWATNQANGDFILFLQNTTSCTPTLLNDLLEPYLYGNINGIICPKIKSFAKPELIHYAGSTPANIFTGKTKTVGFLEKDSGQYNQSNYTHGVFSGAMMAPKAVMEKVGIMPHSFYTRSADLDMTERIKNRGVDIFYNAKSLVYNKQEFNEDVSSPLNTYYEIRNRIKLMKKNSGFLYRIVFYLFLLFIHVPYSIVHFTITGKTTHIPHYINGIIWNFKQTYFNFKQWLKLAPHLLSKRF